MSRPVILIVDDEPIIVQNMIYIFEEAGFEAVGANNAHQALEWAKKQAFDFILTDIRLPDMNGAELIVSLHRQQPRAKIMLHTGANSFDLSPALRECGLSQEDVLLKPIPSVRELAGRLLSRFEAR